MNYVITSCNRIIQDSKSFEGTPKIRWVFMYVWKIPWLE